MDLEDKNITPSMSLGSTGLKQNSGYIDEEFLLRLRGRNGIKLYREMKDNSAVIAAALNAISLLFRQVDWRVEPADESDEAVAEAEDTEAAFQDMSHTFEDFIAEALSFLWAGFSPFEIVYKIRRGPDQKDPKLRSEFNDGKFGWRKIEIRSQDTVERWVFDDEGGLDGFIQQNYYSTAGTAGNNGPVFIPIEKALLFRTDTFKGNPEGRSLLRPAVIPYWYTKRLQEFEAIGSERNLAGMPVMEVPAQLLSTSASAGDRALRQELEKFVTQVRMDERFGGIVPSEVKEDGTPSGFKFKLMQNAGRSAVDTDVVIRRYESRMLMMFLSQFLIMGQDNVGSHALSTDMTSLFGTAIGTIMDQITSVVNRFLIPRRQKLNGIDPKFNPMLVHGDLQGPDIDKVGAYVQKLAAAGLVSSSKPLERKLLEIGDLPQPSEEEGADLPESLRDGLVEDVSNSTLSTEQIRIVLEINAALKEGKLDHPTAVSLVAAAIGVAEDKAQVMVPEHVEPEVAAPEVPELPELPEPEEEKVPDLEEE